MPEQTPQIVKVKSFFSSFPKKVLVLKSFVRISHAFNPKSDLSNPYLHDFEAIWDTGATLTSITKNVVNECNLKPIDIITMSTAGGERKSFVYMINIVLPNNLGFPYLRVCECDIMGADVLIGMNLITLGDFAISNLNDKTSFTFRIPSLEIFDFRTHPPGVKKYKPGPNDPCPCGSGRKYKKCCSIRDKMK